MSSPDEPIDLTPVSPQVQEFFERTDAAPEYGVVETYQPGESTENTLHTPATPIGQTGTAEDVSDLNYGTDPFPTR